MLKWLICISLVCGNVYADGFRGYKEWDSLKDNSLVGHWTFEDNFGYTANDTSGRGNHGVLTNMDSATDWVTGANGNGYALDFDGSSDHIDIPQNSTLDIDTTFTIAFWVYFTSQQATCYLINNYQGTGGQSGDSILIHSNSSGSGNTIEAHIDDNSNPTSWATTTVLAPDVWYHVALVRNYGTDDAKVYINGELDSSQTDTASTSVTSDRDWCFGAKAEGVSSENFDGLLDDIRIYNRALSASEVKRLYFETKR